MSMLMTAPTGPAPTTAAANNTTAAAAAATAATIPARHRGYPRRAAVTTYCTSEQMDLWRQVFAEADRQKRRSGVTTVVPGRSL